MFLIGQNFYIHSQIDLKKSLKIPMG